MEIGAYSPLSNQSAIKMPNAPEATGHQDALMKETARKFEAAFIKQMLDYSGMSDALGTEGNATTESFASFVLEKVADDMVAQGGFGLADQIYQQLAAYQEASATTERV